MNIPHSSSFVSALPTQHSILAPKLEASSLHFPTSRISFSLRDHQDSKTSTFTITTKPLYSSTIPTVLHENKPHVNPPLHELIFNAFHNFLKTHFHHPLHPSLNPTIVLSGNFAPVNELPPTECDVIEGSLPHCLDGVYIRNGPNPQFPPHGPYHVFDGDGMLHCIRISQGGATLCSRYVQTYKYIIERDAGSPIVPRIFSSSFKGLLYLTLALKNQYNALKGIGPANTGLTFFCNRLYALGESDLPYAMRVTPNGDVETLGRCNFNGDLVISMTAHPKIDPETGEVFAYRYMPFPPFLTYFRFDASGKKQPDVPIFSVFSSSFFHDFGLTKKYAVFADIQLQMNFMKLFAGRGPPMDLNMKKMSRIGIIPRYATNASGMRWFDVHGFNMMHAINAWDEEDAVILMASNSVAVENTFNKMDQLHLSVEKLRIDLKTGIVTRHVLSPRHMSTVVINQAYIGKKNRYAYGAVGGIVSKITGVVKLDLSKTENVEDCMVANRMYEPWYNGGEPFFVARQPENEKAEEDDGYVVSYVNDERTEESRFLVMDAKSSDLATVATVRLPQRVPNGFHGIFVSESDLRKQWNV